MKVAQTPVNHICVIMHLSASPTESLASIAHNPDKEVKGVLELKRMVEAWPLGVA